MIRLLKNAVVLLPMIIWLGAHAMAATPDTKGNDGSEGLPNLIANSSFELGVPRLWTPNESVAGGEGLVDRSVAYHGKASVKLSVPAGGSVSFRHRFVKIVSGKTYSVSVHARSSTPGVVVAISAVNGKAQTNQVFTNGIHGKGRLGAKWRRISATGVIDTPPDEGCSVQIDLTSPAAATVWLDAVQLNPGPLADYQPAQEIEATLVSNRQGNLFFDDEAPVLNLVAVNYGGSDQAAQFTVKASDIWERDVATHAAALTVPAHSTAHIAVPLIRGLRGAIRCSLYRKDARHLQDELIIGIVPRPRRMARWPQSSFGNHLGLHQDWTLSLGQKLGIKWVRNHDIGAEITHWNQVEPVKGRFVWHDDMVERALKHGVSILGQLSETPDWANSTGAGGFVFPMSLDDWRNYVYRTVAHYKGRIDAWEIGNEGWGTTGQQAGQLQRIAYEAAKAANPAATVVFQYSTWQGLAYLEPARREGALKSCDVISTHIYVGFDSPSYVEPDDGVTSNTTGLIAQLGSDRADRPIWMTEAGEYLLTWHRNIMREAIDQPYSHSRAGAAPADGAQGARFAPRYYVSFRAAGGDKWFYYYSPGVYSVTWPDNYSIFEYDGSVKPLGITSAVCAHYLDGSRFIKRLDLGKPVTCFLFERDGEGVAVMWSPTDRVASVQLTLPPDLAGKLERVDMMGDVKPIAAHGARATLRVTGDPIYIRSGNLSAAGLAKVLVCGGG
jgi:hypothetical protein